MTNTLNKQRRRFQREMHLLDVLIAWGGATDSLETLNTAGTPTPSTPLALTPVPQTRRFSFLLRPRANHFFEAAGKRTASKMHRVHLCTDYDEDSTHM